MSIVVGARHRWPERAGFCIHRPVGLPTYTLLHFFTPMQPRVGDRLCTTRPGACAAALHLTLGPRGGIIFPK